ncbi:MAG: IS21 family transposase [Planctomycetes bacterium]|nr:IS21 family transposase [Planctomycetota bacterium]
MPAPTPEQPVAPDQAKTAESAPDRARRPARSPHQVKRGRSRPLTPRDEEEIRRLASVPLGSREIARRLGVGRTQVRRILETETPARPSASEQGTPPAVTTSAPAEGLLAPFLTEVERKVGLGLTTSRILREIREGGYTGGRTILAERVRELRAKSAVPPRRKQAKARFETKIAEEMQFDFGTYRVLIGGVETVAHAFLGELAWSRLASVDLFRDQKQSTVFEALAGALQDFDGAAEKAVIDNITSIVLGRTFVDGKRKPLLHPVAEEFAKHHSFEFWPCAPRDPDRKGKDENLVGYFERDFIKGSTFDSWEDLRRRAREWCKNVANKRTHGTTGLVPEVAWRERERDLLARLPATPFAVHRDEPRAVAPDSTLSIGGTLYTVPAELANTVVTVRLFAHHFEVVDREGRVALARGYVDPRDKGKLQLDPEHYASLRRSRDRGRRQRLDEQLRERFPTLGPLLDGITRRMKTLSHVHLGVLARLASRYGDATFLKAATRVQEAGRLDAYAVQRVLERDHPLVDESDPPVATLGGAGAVLLADVDEGSFDRFDALDGDAPSKEDGHGS